MGRRAKPEKVKAKAPENESSSMRDLEQRLAESLERETATSEILSLIGTSPMDAQPVFDGIARSGVKVCGAQSLTLFVVDGDTVRVAATHGVPAERMERFRTQFPVPLSAENHVTQVLRERRIFHLVDIEHNPAATPQHLENARLGGYRTRLMIPLLRGDRVLGLIAVTHQSPAPFPDQQIVLLKTFADQAVIAIENVRLFTELKQRNADVTAALEQQTATSEILRILSQSPTDVQPVFNSIVRSAQRLLSAYSCAAMLRVGDEVHLAAYTVTDGAGDAELTSIFPASVADLTERFPDVRRVWTDGDVLHTPDITRDSQGSEHSRLARARGFRARLHVPMRREGLVIGDLAVTRREPGPFAATEIALLQTFADQAVIAIENVRLFTELQEKNEALTQAHAQVSEALEQQTATGEILRVIASSPTDVQPVLDAIARSVVRLCDGLFGAVFRFDGELLHFAAHYNFTPKGLEAFERVYPVQLTPEAPLGPAILERRIVHIPDTLANVRADYTRPLVEALGHRSLLAVPMLRGETPLGTINVARATPGPFTDTQIELLKTFADQAVIAIENVRLFTELQASNRELTTALDTQTATSEILRVISRSQTDVQPVFDAIVASAVRLLRAYSGALTRIAGDQVELAALTSTDDAGDAALRTFFPQSLRSEGPNVQAIRDRAPVNIADAQTDPRGPEVLRVSARARGYRSAVVVPMLRHDAAIGTISVARREPGGFTDDEITLLQTFADQAVIAIENARLLTELHARTAELTQSVGELRALGEVGQVISSTLDLQTVLSTIVTRATQLAGADAGVIYEYDAEREVFEPRATAHLEPEIVEVLVTAPVRKGEGATGQLAISPEAVQLPDIHIDSLPNLHHARGAFARAGYRALLAVPLLREGHLIGGLTVVRKMPGEFPRETIELLQTFATQSALAVQNARLFREIEDKSRQLEAASRHKSEFLANMSHELRTPLNAIIGFSEVLTERMFGDLNDKQDEYLKDIYASGQHLLSLINDILDLSKIEAGRMELERADFDLPGAIDNALTLVRERAGRRGIMLGRDVDERVGTIHADERKVKQVLLNLLSNALKFTPERGRIDVRAAVSDGLVEVSVADTGVGIAPEDQEAVFEEFRQVGTADKKVEGTGLGLALSRKFIELHGGRIWVKSQVGTGSTFTFTIPARPEPSSLHIT
jgi:GAF domain-containing protein